MVLPAYFVLSPAIGLVVNVIPRIKALSAPGRADKTSAKLDAGVEASEPHDFAVRFSISRLRAVNRSRETRPAINCRAQRCRVHRIPFPTSVTIAIRPSVG